jgi:4,5-dihydroxyphthalate decarboxylase
MVESAIYLYARYKGGVMNRETEQKKVILDYSRREFIKASALTVGAAGVLSVCGQAPAQAADKPHGLSLSMAGYRFDRTKALIDGRVKIEGHDIQFQESGIGDININVLSGPQTYDVTEIGLHPFMLAYANDGFRDYSLLPIFPLRLFRHKSIFIRTDRNIKKT